MISTEENLSVHLQNIYQAHHLHQPVNDPLQVVLIFELLFVVKLGIGGFNIGAAIALYSVVCQVLGRYRNGNPYPINLSILVGLSGWLPCSRFV